MVLGKVETPQAGLCWMGPAAPSAAEPGHLSTSTAALSHSCPTALSSKNV
jgi:hypothetical protein